MTTIYWCNECGTVTCTESGPVFCEDCGEAMENTGWYELEKV